MNPLPALFLGLGLSPGGRAGSAGLVLCGSQDLKQLWMVGVSPGMGGPGEESRQALAPRAGLRPLSSVPLELGQRLLSLEVSASGREL